VAARIRNPSSLVSLSQSLGMMQEAEMAILLKCEDAGAGLGYNTFLLFVFSFA
jgi:hypothetical protein